MDNAPIEILPLTIDKSLQAHLDFMKHCEELFKIRFEELFNVSQLINS